jgi:hypothetical protein
MSNKCYYGQDISDYLNIQSMHDCLLTGILLCDKSILLVNVSDYSGTKKIGNFIFSGLKACRFNDFRLGNIILDISVYTGENRVEFIDNTLCYIFDINKNKITEEWCNVIKSDIYSKKLLLVNFSTSYGAYGSILCEKIKFKEFSSNENMNMPSED